MSEMVQYEPSTFCWPELVASDSEKAKEFYSSLFGWSITDIPIGNDQVYSMAAIGGNEVGAIYQMWPEQEAGGVPTHWASYVSVSDVDESAKKAESSGGQVITGPMDVFDAGRMAALIDPTGAAVSLWQPLNHIGARLVNEHGALCWNELLTNDLKKSAEFYTALFGWTAGEQNIGGINYTVFMNGERPAGGMMEIAMERGQMSPHWLVYFAVKDCDVSADNALSLGGEIISPPADIPEIGRIASLKDSQGAVFAVIKLFAK